MSDGQDNTERKSNTSSQKKGLRVAAYVLSFVLLCTSGYFGYRLYKNYDEHKTARDDWSDVREVAYDEPEPSPTETPTDMQDHHVADTNDNIPADVPKEESLTEEEIIDDPNMVKRIDFDALKAANPDVIAWITIPGTVVDYPIMQDLNYPSKLEEPYYIHRNMYKQYSISGSLFIEDRYKDDVDNSIAHKIIYGHNMRDGTMFSCLLNYKSKDYYDNNKYFYIHYPDRTERWLICAATHVQSTSKMYFTPYRIGTDDYKSLIEELQNTSYYDTGVRKFNPYIPSITLSTCDWTYTDQNGRMAVTGMLDVTLYWD